jgi:hypothetical protein
MPMQSMYCEPTTVFEDLLIDDGLRFQDERGRETESHVVDREGGVGGREGYMKVREGGGGWVGWGRERGEENSVWV